METFPMLILVVLALAAAAGVVTARRIAASPILDRLPSHPYGT